MHTSLVVRRPITSPCLLCTLRAAAADQTNPHIGRRRRSSRRVHSSANRLAGENLARRPEPEDVPQYEPAATYQPPPTAQFQSFLGRTPAAASRWSIKKPQPVVQPSIEKPIASLASDTPPVTPTTTPFSTSERTSFPTIPDRPFTPRSSWQPGTGSKLSALAAAAEGKEKSSTPPVPSPFRLDDVLNVFDDKPAPSGNSTGSKRNAERSFMNSKSQSVKDTLISSAQKPNLSRWGIGNSKKSLFAETKSPAVDRFASWETPQNNQRYGNNAVSFKTTNTPKRGDPERESYMREDYFQDRKDTRERSFLSSQTRQESGHKWSKAEEQKTLDPVEEALQQAKNLSKKKQRGTVEPDDWNRKSSLRARDKSKHGREFVFEDVEDGMDVETKAAKKERKRLEREQKAKERAEQKQQYPPIMIPEFVSISTLARLCKIKLDPFTAKMGELGFTERNPDHVLNAEMAGLIAMEYGFEPIVDKSHERDLFALPIAADKSKLPSRPPVVTIMGHVDHGKTTILDWLRKSSIADQEHGGITQHIGAFSVTMPSGRNITFLDTPGHEAFLNMRERGANMTDIVILVVAADDSIMPQTIEAIKHAKTARVPIIVAVNKCDKEDADPERVKADLAQYEVIIEDVGGDTQVVCVSGKTGLGMEDLEEAVLLQADELDVRADKGGRVEGWVVETTTKTRGRVATVLVRRGTLRKGDVIVAGNTWARVRNLVTENGVEIEEAQPGTPVEIDGWRDQPDAGDEVLQASSEDKAKSVVEYRLFKQERQQLAIDIEAINEQRRLHQIKKDREARLKELEEQGIEAAEAEAELPPLEEDGKFKILEVPFIIKADVAGSVEAVMAQVLSVANDEVRTKVIRSGVGPLVESDVAMAQGTGAYCLTFNVPEDPDILAYARHAGVQMIQHDVIYAILDDIKALMSKKLKPTIIRSVIGEAEIAKVFDYNVKRRETRPFAGCRITRGVITKGSKAKILRNGEVVYDGEIDTLKNVKKDVPEMTQGSECGMGFARFDQFKEGDIVQCYTETKKQRKFD